MACYNKLWSEVCTPEKLKALSRVLSLGNTFGCGFNQKSSFSYPFPFVFWVRIITFSASLQNLDN